jgi:hypothetical protein
VTYATLPSLGSAVQTTSVSQAGAYATVDVTVLVQGWISVPATNNGVALTAGTAVVQFDSKENDLTGHAGVLDVTLVSTGPAGAPGPAGPMGPAGSVGPAGPAGANGAQGPQGLPGVQGVQGPQGNTGSQGALGVNYVGNYQVTANYGLHDAVSFGGTSYISLVAGNLGNAPSVSPLQWAVLAAQGVEGPPGAAGLPEPAVRQALPERQGGNLGNAPSVSPSQWAVLAAQGAEGPAGAIGPIGPPGATGAAGANGAAGATGATGPQCPPVSFLGSWVSGTSYATGSAVALEGRAILR